MKCDLFLGRMQPVHNGHLAIIRKMDNPVVVVVKGEKSSENKTRNPLDADYQLELIKKVAPGAKVIVASTGFLPKIIESIKQKLGLDVKKVFAGEDRIQGYKKQLSSFGVEGVEFEITDRVTSATTVRNSILSNDKKEFEKNVPKAIWSEFDKMRKILQEEVSAVATSNSTEGVAKVDKPMPRAVLKRKKAAEMTEEVIRAFLEKLEIPNSEEAFIKSRKSMPQITDIDRFLDDLKNAGVKFGQDQVDPEKLSPTQTQFNEDKVNSLIAKGNWGNSPIFVSNDNFIIDGHHRWLAAAKSAANCMAVVVGMGIRACLDFLEDKPYVEKKTVHQ